MTFGRRTGLGMRGTPSLHLTTLFRLFAGVLLVCCARAENTDMPDDSILSCPDPLIGQLNISGKGKGAEAAPKEEAYLAFYFKDIGDQDGLFVAASEEGVRWEELTPLPLLQPAIGNWKSFRDPSVARDAEGVFHLVWTAGNDGFGYTSSRDLITWAQPRLIRTSEGDVSAPLEERMGTGNLSQSRDGTPHCALVGDGQGRSPRERGGYAVASPEV